MWSEAAQQQGFSLVNGIWNGTTNRTLSWQFVQWQGMIKVERLYSTAMVAYYSKQCYLREINVFLLSGTNYQEYAGKKHISQTVDASFLPWPLRKNCTARESLAAQCHPILPVPGFIHPVPGWNCWMGGSQKLQIFPDAGVDLVVPGLVSCGTSWNRYAVIIFIPSYWDEFQASKRQTELIQQRHMPLETVYIS